MGETPVTTAVLKVAFHCKGCLHKIGKNVLKFEGVHEMAINKEKETVTVKGTMDVKALQENLMKKLNREVEVVPPKKHKDNDKENGGGGGGRRREKEGSGKKKNNGGVGGDGNEKDEKGAGKMTTEQNRREYLAPAPLPPSLVYLFFIFLVYSSFLFLIFLISSLIFLKKGK